MRPHRRRHRLAQSLDQNQRWYTLRHLPLNLLHWTAVANVVVVVVVVGVVVIALHPLFSFTFQSLPFSTGCFLCF